MSWKENSRTYQFFSGGDNVTLFVINIDFILKLDGHVADICKKASKQLAVLKRLGRFLAK